MQAAVSRIVYRLISLFRGTSVQKFVEVIVRVEVLLDKLNSLPSCLIPNHRYLVLDVSDGSVPAGTTVICILMKSICSYRASDCIQ